MKERWLSAFGEREETPIDMLVLHCSVYPVDKTLAIFEEYGVSSHYLIDEDGEVFCLVPEEKSAYHGGIGFWKGQNASINKRSIGIELVHPTLGQSPYSKKQIDALIPLCQKILKKYSICPQNVVGHSDVAPLRKADPGKCFPWQKLAQNGIGLWYNQDDASKMGEDCVSVLLSKIGYNVCDEDNLCASAYAFCRRFLPEEVTVDQDVMHLVDNVYPKEDKSLLKKENFVKCLKAVAYRYEKLENILSKE